MTRGTETLIALTRQDDEEGKKLKLGQRRGGWKGRKRVKGKKNEKGEQSEEEGRNGGQ